MRDYNVKSIRQDFKEKGIFYTTKDLAEYLKSFLPDDVHEIYEIIMLIWSQGIGKIKKCAFAV